jgi:hypothetical protein
VERSFEIKSLKTTLYIDLSLFFFKYTKLLLGYISREQLDKHYGVYRCFVKYLLSVPLVVYKFENYHIYLHSKDSEKNGPLPARLYLSQNREETVIVCLNIDKDKNKLHYYFKSEVNFWNSLSRRRRGKMAYLLVSRLAKLASGHFYQR